MGGLTGGYGDGLITATLKETFEPLHTGHSLIFTIAPNGHVWGKKLDDKSGKNDVEIEIFAPERGGYLVRKQGAQTTTHHSAGNSKSFVTMSGILITTAEQDKKIKTILAQKERIYYLLGTLMLRSHEVSLVGNYHHWNHSHRKLERPSINPEGLPYAIKVVDCSYEPIQNCLSGLRHLELSYDDASFRFRFNAKIRTRLGPDKEEGYNDIVFDPIQYPEFGKNFPRFHYFTAQAENKKFDLRSWNHKTLPPELKIMYGEYNFFDYFEIDDAVLLLEEERTSETESKFYWTIGVAQNKLARNLMRLKSNNPELLAT